MKKVTWHKSRLVVLVVLLALLTYLVAHRNGLTEKATEDEAIGAVARLKNMVIYDDYAIVAFLALVATFAFVAWTVLRANEGEDKAMRGGQPAGRSETAR